jgi:colanic acid biosynthesis glycosyl transferase WcaI
MRLLVVSQYFWPENFRINDLVAELVRRGHEVTVLTGEPNYPQGEIFPEYRNDKGAFASFEGAEVIRVPLRPRHKGNLNLALNYLSFVVSAGLRGPWTLRGRRFDAMFVYQPSPVTVGLPAMLLKAIKRVPMAFWVLDLWPQSLSAVGVTRSPAVLGAVDALVRLIYRSVDLILVQSRSFVNQIARQAGGDERIGYFPSWSDDRAPAAPAVPAPEILAANATFSVMFTGNVGDAQDFPAILDAAELLRHEPVRWLIVGDGRRSDWLAAEVARRNLGGQVLLLGRHPLERMPSFLAHADAALVALRPEPAFAMTIPGKVQTYLAAGKPILGMIDGEGAEVIQHAGAGFTAPAGDAPALAEAIRRMMALPAEQRVEMGLRGQEFAQREFDRDALVDRLEGWLEQLVARNGARRPRM